jgi:serine protease Do
VKKPSIVLAGLLFLGVLSLSAAEDRKERVLNDRKNVEASGDWIYNDLPKGFAEAKRTGKPLMVVIRCIP